MSLWHEHKSERASDSEKCVARSVLDALSVEPTLEAVTIDRVNQKISVATLGQTDESRLTETVTNRIQPAYENGLAENCLLLHGKNDCHICHSPLSETELGRITIRSQGDSTTIARATCPTAPKFWRWRDLPFPKVVQRDVEFLEEAENIEHHINEWKPQLAAAILCGVFGLAGFFAGQTSSLSHFQIIFYAAAYLAGGFYPAEEVWERLQQRAIDVHFLMLAVAVGAATIGAWAEGATLLFLFSLSGALEHFALGRTQKEIRSLFREAPKSATVLENGREREVKVEQLKTGMRLLIKPGAQFPVDAEIAKGATAADESNLTGEAAPAEKTIGDTVLAGTINLWGAVETIVLRPASQSSLQKIIQLIREAQHQKAPSQRFTDKFGTAYTYFVLAMFVVMLFVWHLVSKLPLGLHFTPLAAHADTNTAFYHAMTLLVVASPCALVLSIPSAVLAAIAWSARHGILFRGGAAVEKLAEVNVVALDKTGTLTTGELKVEKVESFPPGNENEIARLAYSLEKLSEHPLARAITRYGKQQNLQPIEFEHFESITGHGLCAKGNGDEVFLGKRDWIESRTGVPPARVSEAGAMSTLTRSLDRRDARPTLPGISEIWIARGDLVGRILLRDDIRPQSRAVIDELRGEKLKTVVLTGDRKSAAENLRTQLHLDDVRAELKPEEKVAAIRDLSAQKNLVAMIGDGVNDAPSLAAAHIGVAMGARGSDAALEQADVVLMHDKLENFLTAFRLSRRARRIIRTNLVISLGTVVVLVTFAMLGKIPLTIGVVGHEGSTVVVVMNSLRLLFGAQNQKS